MTQLFHQPLLCNSPYLFAQGDRIFGKAAVARASIVYDQYMTWCGGDRPMSKKHFGQAMAERGFKSKTMRDGREVFKAYIGAQLVTDVTRVTGRAKVENQESGLEQPSSASAAGGASRGFADPVTSVTPVTREPFWNAYTPQRVIELINAGAANPRDVAEHVFMTDGPCSVDGCPFHAAPAPGEQLRTGKMTGEELKAAAKVCRAVKDLWVKGPDGRISADGVAEWDRLINASPEPRAPVTPGYAGRKPGFKMR